MQGCATGARQLEGGLRVAERDFQATIIELARTLGWRVAHFRAARTAHGWRTPVAGDGAGFPDLVLVRPPRLIFVELKAERGRLRGEQEAWLEALRNCAGCQAFVWRPEPTRLALTFKQQWALEFLIAHRDGVSPAELGAAWLGRQGRTGAYAQAWAHDSGRSVLYALRGKRLAVQRRKLGNRWFAVGHEAGGDRIAGPGDLPEGF